MVGMEFGSGPRRGPGSRVAVSGRKSFSIAVDGNAAQQVGVLVDLRVRLGPVGLAESRRDRLQVGFLPDMVSLF
jgi:hypothetical protein